MSAKCFINSTFFTESLLNFHGGKDFAGKEESSWEAWVPCGEAAVVLPLPSSFSQVALRRGRTGRSPGRWWGDQSTPLPLAQQPGGGRACAESVSWVQRETTLRPRPAVQEWGTSGPVWGRGRGQGLWLSSFALRLCAKSSFPTAVLLTHEILPLPNKACVP